MVNKNTAVQMDGFWRVCMAGWRPVWHGWKWGWNAGGWGSKSHFEASRGVTNAMGVCRLRPWALSLRRRPTSKYTPRPPQVLDGRCSLPSSPALWMPWLHAALLAVPHRHAVVRSRRPCRESSRTVDPHALRTVDTPARDHGIGRPRQGGRLSATKPGGEQQASCRASGRRTSTTLAVGGRQGARSPQNVASLHCPPQTWVEVRFGVRCSVGNPNQTSTLKFSSVGLPRPGSKD